ncbi:response regulator [Pelagibacterium montanilacus]|uniref:response regulator n=1 Tax=Pelagibacterium montanilacus TaxID=2185280 RepID=UPI0013E04D02|nr:response regulator [Pelagibacterium montanilacus]
MSLPLPIVAVLSTSRALSSILGATLRDSADWRVREFTNPEAMAAYMRISPVALVVCDYDLGPNDNAADLVARIRTDELIVSRAVEVIAMSRTVEAKMRERCAMVGINEVVAKPMSPRYLAERVTARIAARRQAPAEPRPAPVHRPRPTLAEDDNVVSLLAHKALRARAIRDECPAH